MEGPRVPRKEAVVQLLEFSDVMFEGPRKEAIIPVLELPDVMLEAPRVPSKGAVVPVLDTSDLITFWTSLLDCMSTWSPDEPYSAFLDTHQMIVNTRQTKQKIYLIICRNLNSMATDGLSGSDIL